MINKLKENGHGYKNSQGPNLLVIGNKNGGSNMEIKNLKEYEINGQGILYKHGLENNLYVIFKETVNLGHISLNEYKIETLKLFEEAFPYDVVKELYQELDDVVSINGSVVYGEVFLTFETKTKRHNYIIKDWLLEYLIKRNYHVYIKADKSYWNDIPGNVNKIIVYKKVKEDI